MGAVLLQSRAIWCLSVQCRSDVSLLIAALGVINMDSDDSATSSAKYVLLCAITESNCQRNTQLCPDLQLHSLLDRLSNFGSTFFTAHLSAFVVNQC